MDSIGSFERQFEFRGMFSADSAVGFETLAGSGSDGELKGTIRACNGT
jgi:hypothetical protein